jgi:CRP-like cAMP-binding protein
MTFFGELCLAGGERSETATAMEDSILKQMSSADFLARVTHDGLGKDLITCLATRLGRQQHLITNLALWTVSTAWPRHSWNSAGSSASEVF